MPSDRLLYLPIAPFGFALLVAAFFLLVFLIELRILRHAYLQLGVSPRAAMGLLLGSLVGSYINLPIAEIDAGPVSSLSQSIDYFWMRYPVPGGASPSTIVAINVGGGLIPILTSLYLLVRHRLWLRGAVAIAVVSIVCYRLATPVPGLGIAVPIFVPALTTAVVAMILASYRAAPLAYIAGSLGTLIGADLLNLPYIYGLGSPIVSIGGAGTFDGIFLTSILAVLLASFTAPRLGPQPG